MEGGCSIGEKRHFEMSGQRIQYITIYTIPTPYYDIFMSFYHHSDAFGKQELLNKQTKTQNTSKSLLILLAEDLRQSNRNFSRKKIRRKKDIVIAHFYYFYFHEQIFNQSNSQ